MFMDKAQASLVSPTRLQKMVLAKRIGQFLANDQVADERRVVENVARMLAEDVSVHVREVLAYELRNSAELSRDLAERIACDVESVSGPFLATARCFTDEQLADLIPRLEEAAQISIARRPDLSPAACHAVVKVAGEKPVTYLVRNDSLCLPEQAIDTLLERFKGNKRLMDHLSARVDLPLLMVEEIAKHVSAHCRTAMMQHYGVKADVAEQVTGNSFERSLWEKIKDAGQSQVHGYVVDLRNEERLTFDLVLQMAEKGSLYFLESAMAVEAGRTIAEVRDSLSMAKKSDFVSLMQEAKVPPKLGPRFLSLAHKHYSM